MLSCIPLYMQQRINYLRRKNAGKMLLFVLTEVEVIYKLTFNDSWGYKSYELFLADDCKCFVEMLHTHAGPPASFKIILIV